jgi:hypothetical protein
MNTSAILCHNISTFRGSAFGITWKQLSQADCGFTGASSLNLILSAFTNLQNKSLPSRLFSHLLAISLGLVSVYIPFYAEMHGLKYGNEVPYIGFTVLAALILTPALFSAKLSKTQYSWFMFANVGSVISLAALGLNHWMCARFDGVVNFVHLVFLGCNISFFGLLQMLLSSAPIAVKLKRQ